MYQSDKFASLSDSSSSLNSDSDTTSDSDSDDLVEGVTVLTVGGKVVDLSQGESCTTVVNASGFNNIQIGKGRCTIVGASNGKHRGRKLSSNGTSQPRHRAYKLSDSKYPPSKEDVSHICNNIGRRWRRLALALGLSMGTVDCIEADFKPEGSYEMAWQSLLKWTRQHGDQARLCDVVRALDDIGMTELAMELPV